MSAIVQTGPVTTRKVKAIPKRTLLPNGRPKRKRIPFVNSAVKLIHLQRMCQLWARMQSGGASTLEVLDMLAETYEDESYPIATALDEVHVRIKQGDTLGKAFEAQERVFGTEFVACIAVGEDSGTVDTQLERLAHHYKTEHRARQGIKQLVIYPTFLTVVSAAVIYIMVVIVVPQLLEVVLALPGFKLPWPTRAVIAGYNLIMSWVGVVIAVSAACTVAGLTALYATSEGFRLSVSGFALKVPVIGKLILYRSLAKSFSTLGLIVAATGDVSSALVRAGKASPNLEIRRAFIEAQPEQRKGRATDAVLIETGLMPPTARMTLASCEKTGDYGDPLIELADTYLEEVEFAREQVMEMMKHLTIIIFGTLIGFIVIAFYWPMFSMFDAIK